MRHPLKALTAIAILLTGTLRVGGACGIDIPNFSSLHITRIERSSRTIRYLPLRLTSSKGNNVALLRATDINSYTVLSGLVTFGPESSDLKRLAQLAQKRLGFGFRLTQVAPKAFAIRVLDGETVLWERKLASGSVQQIPIQFTLHRERLHGVQHFNAEVVLYWEEPTPRVAERLWVNWTKVQSALRLKKSEEGSITEEALDAVCATSIASDWIKVEPLRSSSEAERTGEVMDIVRTLIVRSLLKQGEIGYGIYPS